MLEQLNAWFNTWEGIWLFLSLYLGNILEFGCLVYAIKEIKLAREEIDWAKKEYEYDEQKDIEKKQRRTRTTKKTTTKPGGESVIEEQTETTETMGEAKDEPK